MDRFIPPEKRSKKEQKKLNAKRRRTWGDMSPVTRTVPNGKAYNRKKLKNDERRNSRNYREDGPAVLLLWAVRSADPGGSDLPAGPNFLLNMSAFPAILRPYKILRKARYRR